MLERGVDGMHGSGHRPKIAASSKRHIPGEGIGWFGMGTLHFWSRVWDRDTLPPPPSLANWRSRPANFGKDAKRAQKTSKDVCFEILKIFGGGSYFGEGSSLWNIS